MTDTYVEADPGDYPAQFSFQGPYEIARWRPLVHWIMAIPHFVVLYVIGLVATVLWIISFFTILFTRRIPDGVFSLQVMYHRYQLRVNSFYLGLREAYPPFSFDSATADPGDDPHVTLDIPNPGEFNRFAPLYKWLLIIPHLFLWWLIGIAAFFAMVAAWFAVLVTGRYPAGVRSFVVNYLRYGLRITAYAALLRDEYPPFGLK